MIRIFTEAKEDFERCLEACMNAWDEYKHNIYGNRNPTDPDLDERIKNQYKNMIDQFNTYKSSLYPPFNDITYWTKRMKTAGADGLREFSSVAKGVKNESEAKKLFKKKYPSNVVRRFEQNKNKLTPPRNFYFYWVDVEFPDEEDEELETELRIALKDVAGYSDEEKEEIEQGAEVLLKSNGWTVYKITNYLAAEYYGQGTGWCISGNYPGSENRGIKHFNDYFKSTANPHGYFFILKDNGNSKYCVFRRHGNVEIWDGTDGRDEHIPQIYGLPRTVTTFMRDKLGLAVDVLEIPETEDEQMKLIHSAFRDETYQSVYSATLVNMDVFDQFLDGAFEVLFGADTLEEAIQKDVIIGLNNDLIFAPKIFANLYDVMYDHQEMLEHKFNGFKLMKRNEFDYLDTNERQEYLVENEEYLVAALQESFKSYHNYVMFIISAALDYSKEAIVDTYCSWSGISDWDFAEIAVYSGLGAYLCEVILNGDKDLSLIRDDI